MLPLTKNNSQIITKTPTAGKPLKAQRTMLLADYQLIIRLMDIGKIKEFSHV